MKSASAVLAVASIFALGSVSVNADQSRQTKRIKEMLVRGMDLVPGRNIVAIIDQPLMDGSSAKQKIKLEISKDGKIHKQILEPLSMQGIEIVDDGKQLSIYEPDERKISRQVSPRIRDMESKDSKFRIELIVKNYRLKMVPGPDRDDRDTVVITAIPRNPELETRRITLDKETAFPLKLESVSKSGSAKVTYEVSSVEFPKELSSDTFDFRFTNARVLNFPVVASTGGSHMHPILPEDLPMGFEVQGCDPVPSTRWKAMVVRVTDGFVRGQLYQWKPGESDPPELPTMGQYSKGESNGIVFLLIMDAPPSVREKLIGAFKEAASKDAPRFRSQTTEVLGPSKSGTPAPESVVQRNVGPDRITAPIPPVGGINTRRNAAGTPPQC